MTGHIYSETQHGVSYKTGFYSMRWTSHDNQHPPPAVTMTMRDHYSNHDRSFPAAQEVADVAGCYCSSCEANRCEQPLDLSTRPSHLTCTTLPAHDTVVHHGRSANTHYGSRSAYRCSSSESITYNSNGPLDLSGSGRRSRTSSFSTDGTSVTLSPAAYHERTSSHEEYHHQHYHTDPQYIINSYNITHHHNSDYSTHNHCPRCPSPADSTRVNFNEDEQDYDNYDVPQNSHHQSNGMNAGYSPVLNCTPPAAAPTTRSSTDNTKLLWEFLYEHLVNKTDTELVRWVDEERLMFRIATPQRLAILWGLQKGRPGMTYDKLARALRYYYKVKIISKVKGKRLTYRFLKHPKLIVKGQRGAKPGVPHHPRTKKNKPAKVPDVQATQEQMLPSPTMSCTSTLSTSSVASTPSCTSTNSTSNTAHVPGEQEGMSDQKQHGHDCETGEMRTDEAMDDDTFAAEGKNGSGDESILRRELTRSSQ